MKNRIFLSDIFNNTVIFILIILIFIFSLFLSILNNKEELVNIEKPKYHFYFIGQNSSDPLWKTVKKGIEDAAYKYNVAVEYNSPRFTNVDEELKYLDIAITSNVDGIITHASNNIEFTNLINNAYRKRIPVVTIENDNKDSARLAFVGSNSFLLGEEAGKLMLKATKGNARIAVIVNTDNEQNIISHNLKINGFLSAIKNYPNMSIVNVYTSKLGILSAEEITQSILNSELNIDAIYTTNSVDTIGSAQLIVDLNKVDKVNLVGYGDSEEIIRYIKKGIIYGTVMSDPYKMGYTSVKSLIDIKENNNISTFLDTGIEIITNDNINEYTKNAIRVE